MRDYGKVAPTFWTGDTGRRLRRMGPKVQLVALYLITGPHANMIGLYYTPLPVLCHETGLPLEGALKALASLSEGGFAWYDKGSEVVWIPEMARFQLGETVVPKDHRHKAIIREAEKYRKSAFFSEFYRRYRDSYHLPEPSPLEAPSKPLPSQEQEQEQEQEQKQENEQDAGAGDIAASPPVGDPEPVVERKPKARDLLWDAIVEVTGADTSIRTVASHVGKVKKALNEAKPPYEPHEVLALPEYAAVHLPWSAGRVLTLGEVEKNIGLVRAASKPVRVRSKGDEARDQIIDNTSEWLGRGGSQ